MKKFSLTKSLIRTLSAMLTAFMMLSAFSSFTVIAQSADLIIKPKTENELTESVLSGLKDTVKNRKNETVKDGVITTSYSVLIKFDDYLSPKLQVDTDEGVFTASTTVASLGVFDILSDDSELDYEFLTFKGNSGGTSVNTFSINFSDVQINSSNEVLEMKITYLIIWGESKAEAKSVADYCDACVRDILTPSMSDYEKIKTIHDYITTTFDYATEALENGDENIFYPSYMIANGKGVCQAYTSLFIQMMRSAGLGDKVIAVRHNSKAKTGGGHSWNMVKLDGNWYHIDLTWDDTGNGFRTKYFLKSDSTFAADHRWRDSFYPVASADYSVKDENTSQTSSENSSETENPSSNTTSESSSESASSEITSSAEISSSVTSSSVTSSSETSSETISSETSSSETSSSETSSETSSSETTSVPTVSESENNVNLFGNCSNRG